MMNSDEQFLDLLLCPFDFELLKQSAISNAPVDFAAKRIEQHSANAAEDKKQGRDEEAAAESHQVQYWKSLEHLSANDKLHAVVAASGDAASCIDTLLTLAKDSHHAVGYLGRIAEQALAGLNALAANGDKQAASRLVTSLYQSVDRFNVLAYHKVDLFREVAQSKDGLPGIISLHIEKKEVVVSK